MNLEDLNLVRGTRHELGTPDAMRALGRKIAKAAAAGDFFGLIGNLGAGKTTFMQGFVSEFAGEAVDVLSPTYTLVNSYKTTPPIHHFDLYRLESLDDLESIGYWDVVESDGISCVEWLDKIPGAWPENVKRHLILQFEYEGEARSVQEWA